METFKKVIQVSIPRRHNELLSPSLQMRVAYVQQRTVRQLDVWPAGLLGLTTPYLLRRRGFPSLLSMKAAVTECSSPT